MPKSKPQARCEVETKSQCQDCGKIFTEDQLQEITHGIWERVAPGEPMPSGECPECGSLCQPYEIPKKNKKTTAQDLLTALVRIAGTARRSEVYALQYENPIDARSYRNIYQLAESAIARAERKQ